jgi:hypothetical protein
MTNHPLSTRPLSDNEKLLREKFYTSITAQSDLMDKLSERLLTLELAIPGLYATALKLAAGDKATLLLHPPLYFTFACWLAALVLTLIALTPRKWVVDPGILKQDPQKFSEGLGIQDFFAQSALYKRRLVAASSLLLLVGTFSTIFSLG